MQLQLLRLPLLVLTVFSELTRELLDLRATACGQSASLFATVIDCCSCCCCLGFPGW